MRKFMLLLALSAFSAVAMGDDDGFIWVDANTKIKLKPIGKTAGSAAGGATKAPEPKKKEKQETPKK